MKDKKNNLAMWLFSEKVSNGLCYFAAGLVVVWIIVHLIF